jgi:hypothetical protein
VRTCLSSLKGNASRFEPLWITVLWREAAFRGAYSRHVPSFVESAVRCPPAPPSDCGLLDALGLAVLKEAAVMGLLGSKIVGLDVGLTSNFCSRDMRQIRRRMRYPCTGGPKFGVP